MELNYPLQVFYPCCKKPEKYFSKSGAILSSPPPTYDQPITNKAPAAGSCTNARKFFCLKKSRLARSLPKTSRRLLPKTSRRWGRRRRLTPTDGRRSRESDVCTIHRRQRSHRSVASNLFKINEPESTHLRIYETPFLSQLMFTLFLIKLLRYGVP